MTTISKLSDLMDIFNRYSEGETRRGWLFGPRTRGSTAEHCITTLTDREVVEITPPKGSTVKGCRYFSVYAPELKGRQGAIPFSELTSELRPLLKARDAENSTTTELYLDRSYEEAKAHGLPQQAYMVVIIGPEGDPWTWYPMPVLAALTVNGKPNLEAEVGSLAIKLHREC